MNAAATLTLSRRTQATRSLPDIADPGTVFSTSYARVRNFHNTNKLVGSPGWDILLSKTGTTAAAGRCVGDEPIARQARAPRGLRGRQTG
jgi:D-alanyl-D-alanine endopeptidase (penicillin-binding protein 7)